MKSSEFINLFCSNLPTESTLMDTYPSVDFVVKIFSSSHYIRLFASDTKELFICQNTHSSPQLSRPLRDLAVSSIRLNWRKQGANFYLPLENKICSFLSESHKEPFRLLSLTNSDVAFYTFSDVESLTSHISKSLNDD